MSTPTPIGRTGEEGAYAQQTRDDTPDSFKRKSVTNQLLAEWRRNEEDQKRLVSNDVTKELRIIDEALADWQDEQTAQIVQAYLDMAKAGTVPRVDDVVKWIANHPNAPEAVVDCIRLLPPEEVSIIRRLSTAGSQKVVFHGTWRARQREVVVKRIIGAGSDVIILREGNAHPLSLQHPNIIETHSLRNTAHETFLVEKYIKDVLHDGWKPSGTQDVSNLLFHIGSALQYLHHGLHGLELVHGDVKPDNIGKLAGVFVLLDFGICRKTEDFDDIAATGSLRTRAPELLIADGYDQPQKADVWALGATVFHVCTGRFPLFDENEKIPRVSTPEEREKMEAELRRRVEDEWEDRVAVDTLSPASVGKVLVNALAKDPADRCDAAELLSTVETELGAFITRITDAIDVLAPEEDLRQLTAGLPFGRALDLMPTAKRDKVVEKLESYSSQRSLDEDMKRKAETLLRRLREVHKGG